MKKNLVCCLLAGLVLAAGISAQQWGTDDPNYFSADYNPHYTASSIMMEEIPGGMLIYAAQNLGRSLYVVAGEEEEIQYQWNPNHLPWMEGVPGDGVGQTIQLSCAKPFSSLNILNGYVVVGNPSLFKKNGRAKSVRIEDLDNGLVYQVEFADEIGFTPIPLKQPTTKVRFTITAVYSGTEYEDTCISAIIPEQTPSVFSFLPAEAGGTSGK